MSATLSWKHPLADEAFKESLVLVIAPYVTRAALAAVLESNPPPPGFQVVTSWKADSLMRGAADPEIFPLIRENGGYLYLHETIHLKLYISSEQRAVLSTGNLTRRGLGLAPESNVEASTYVTLGQEDWQYLNQILGECRVVTDEVYRVAKDFVQEHRISGGETPKLEFPPDEDGEKSFSYLSLPLTRNVEDLWEAYQHLGESGVPQEVEVMHDLNLYRVGPGLSRELFFERLGDGFRSHPFVRECVAWLQDRNEPTLFGAVKAWIHNNCSDKPTPRRKNLTLTIQALYRWLDYHYSEIQITQPRHSELIAWVDAS